MISIIAAIGKNNELGKNNDLIWHIKDDLKYFQSLTMGKKIVMGANTYKSLPKKLQGRKYVILSKSLKGIEDALVYQNFDELLAYLNELDEEVMVIGGASIYELFIPYADKLYLTEVDATAPADVFFPQFDKEKYNKKIIKECLENNINYKFVVYERYL